MSRMHRGEKLGLEVKTLRIVDKILSENPEIKDIFESSETSMEARMKLREWVLICLNKNPHTKNYYLKKAKGHGALKRIAFRDYATIRLMDYLDNEGRNYTDPNGDNEVIVSRPIKNLWLAIRQGKGTANEDFFMDLLFLFRQFNGGLLRRQANAERIAEWMDRHPSGLDDDIQSMRLRNKERIIRKIVKKIDAGKLISRRFVFAKGLSNEEKYEQALDWWKDYRFHLVFAIRTPEMLNEMLDYSLRKKTMKMLKRAKSILQTNEFTALYDKGYHTGSEFKTADELGIEVMVAIPSVAAQAPNPDYNVENFIYNKEGDFYICPQGIHLNTTGSWHKTRTYNFKRYTTKHCMQCSVKQECSKAKYGKGIQRSEYQKLISRNKKRINRNKDYYRRRQAIVEHPYGTVKRQWGFSYIMTKKGKKRASADVGLMFTAYNLRRIFNILGKEDLVNYLNIFAFALIGVYQQIRLHFIRFKTFNFQSRLNVQIVNVPSNLLIFNQNLMKTTAF